MNVPTKNHLKRKYWDDNQIPCTICHEYDPSVKLRQNPYACEIRGDYTPAAICHACIGKLREEV